MQIIEFADEVRKGIEDRCHCRTAVAAVLKNNGVTLTAIIARDDSGICPNIYIDDAYRAYEDGKDTLDKITDKLCSVYMEERTKAPSVDVSSFKSWEHVRGRLFAKVINTEMNRELLEQVPHREIVDLSIVYYVVVDNSSDAGIGSVLVKNEHIPLWGVDEKALYRNARVNMHCLDGLECKSLIRLLYEQMGMPDDSPAPDDGPEMYILTNKARIFGASVLINDGMLREAAEYIGGDLYIIPSSIHELLAIRQDPLDISQTPSELAKIVKEVNDTQVKQEELLSYHVYTYSASDGRLQIAL